ncbi:MAG: DUF72 domain-containing protein [Candidatus Eremiobacteraeota bacterium]|nr:DUF72 domain-containing protein [Candidatus Eremiobacteraeota bacterium]MCW5872836.1 DUF72 domain-containing protein [Candidatus Eremiobacteraeota bacterium]
MVWIGLSGYVYQHWKGAFYPEGLAQRRWLGYCGQFFQSLELNGTFYSLKSPSIFRRWRSEVPQDFLFAVKGSRYITHQLKLRHHQQALANFCASGVLALGRQMGPWLWQIPEVLRFDPERMETFLAGLPRTTGGAAELAEHHDARIQDPLCECEADLPLRHCFEVRHPSFGDERFYDLLRRYQVAFVWADTAGRFFWGEEVTTDWVYVRLHGSQQLYVSRYSDAELDRWAARIDEWRRRALDVYVYFDNDGLGHAPYDALRLRQRVEGIGEVPEIPEGFRGRV